MLTYSSTLRTGSRSALPSGRLGKMRIMFDPMLMRCCLVIGASVFIFFSCADRALKIKEQKVEFGADKIKSAVKEFSIKGAGPENYREFVLAMDELDGQLNLETEGKAAYWLVVLAYPLMHDLVDETFYKEAEVLGLNVWPHWLGEDPKPSSNANEYFEKLCSGSKANDCRHLVPEAWPAVFSLLAWTNLQEKASEVFDACLDCDGVHDTKSVRENIESDLKKIELKTAEVLEKASPFLWPVAFDGLDPFDGLKTLMSCGEQGMCESDHLSGQKLKKPKDVNKIALHVKPKASVGDLRRSMKKLHTNFGKSTELYLLFREKDFPYKLKEKLLDHESRLTKGMRIEDQDSLQLWVQAKAAQN